MLTGRQQLPQVEVTVRVNWQRARDVGKLPEGTHQCILEYRAIRELLVRLRQQDTPVWQGE